MFETDVRLYSNKTERALKAILNSDVSPNHTISKNNSNKMCVCGCFDLKLPHEMTSLFIMFQEYCNCVLGLLKLVSINIPYWHVSEFPTKHACLFWILQNYASYFGLHSFITVTISLNNLPRSPFLSTWKQVWTRSATISALSQFFSLNFCSYLFVFYVINITISLKLYFIFEIQT
jgi:hypothetical protein